MLPANIGEGVFGSNSGGVKPLGASAVSVASVLPLGVSTASVASALPSAAAARIEWRKTGFEEKESAEGCLKEEDRRGSMAFAEDREDGEKSEA